MKLKVFTLGLDPATGFFDDTEVERFLENREVLSVSENFFVHELKPTWALLVLYRDIERPGDSKRLGNTPNWRAALNEDERPLFDALRSWRNDKARAEGKPAYLYLTNREIQEIARRLPDSLAALRAIEGIGDNKVRDVGEEILTIVAASRGGSREGPPPDGTAGEEGAADVEP
jgi:superfamily II DNA helicase RecQ